MEFYASQASAVEPLLIDFAESDYIDIPVLTNLIALSISRRDQNQETYLGVSHSKAVRDFLRVWKFPEAFRDATGISFEKLIVEEDQNYRGEAQTTYRGSGNGIDALEYDADWKEGYPGRRNFFEFTTYKLRETPASAVRPGAIARCEGSHWNGDLIKEVLTTHLPSNNPQDDVARVVIYEALSNCVRHPNAKVVQAVSRFERYPNGKPSQLRICVWDDGEGIVSTLKPLIANGLPIRSVRLPTYMYDRIVVRTRQYGGEFDQGHVEAQENDPTTNTPDHIILLASLYPGTSRSVSVQVPDVEKFEDDAKKISPQASPLDSKAGMGLYALTRTVVDGYRGSLILRTGCYLLQLELAHDAFVTQFRARYKAKVTLFSEGCLPFKGNLLTIQLPVRSSS